MSEYTYDTQSLNTTRVVKAEGSIDDVSNHRSDSSTSSKRRN